MPFLRIKFIVLEIEYEMDIKQSQQMENNNPVFFGNELFLLEINADDLDARTIFPKPVKWVSGVQ